MSCSFSCLLLLFNQNNHLFPFFAAQFSSAALHSTRNENERKAKVLRNQCSLNNKLTINSIISTTDPNVTSCSSHQPCQDNAPSWTERQRPNQQNAKPTSWVRSSGLLFLFTDTHPSQRFTKRARPLFSATAALLFLMDFPDGPSWWSTKHRAALLYPFPLFLLTNEPFTLRRSSWDSVYTGDCSCCCYSP